MRFGLNHLHEIRDLVRGLRRVLRELPNLVGDDCESRSGLSRAGRLDRSVQGEQVCL